jgi:hypothetical protein
MEGKGSDEYNDFMYVQPRNNTLSGLGQFSFALRLGTDLNRSLGAFRSLQPNSQFHPNDSVVI